MDVTSAWTSEERFEVAKVLSRASHEDKDQEKLTPFSWGRTRRMMRFIFTVLNGHAATVETSRNEIMMEYHRCRREQELQDRSNAIGQSAR